MEKIEKVDLELKVSTIESNLGDLDFILTLDLEKEDLKEKTITILKATFKEIDNLKKLIKLTKIN